jgi:hypothetical protein
MTDMNSELIFYRTPDSDQKIEIAYQDESFRLSQKTLSELLGLGTPAIKKHVKSIYEPGELEREATVSKMETVRDGGWHQ